MTDALVHFLAVGQGDCTLITDSASSIGVMVDCPPQGAARAIEEIGDSNVGSLATVFVTHNDIDHIGGIFEVVTAIPTDEIRINFATALPSDPDERKKLRAALRGICGLEKEGVAVVAAERGASGSAGVISWDVLAPTHAQIGHAQANSKPNHSSIVTLLTVSNTKVLIAGDADSASWKMVLDSGAAVVADFLLMPHHGGELAATGDEPGARELLAAVDPELVYLSFGKANTYGHPNNDTLEAIKAHGCVIAASTASTPTGPVQAPLARVGTTRVEVSGGVHKLL